MVDVRLRREKRLPPSESPSATKSLILELLRRDVDAVRFTGETPARERLLERAGLLLGWRELLDTARPLLVLGGRPLLRFRTNSSSS